MKSKQQILQELRDKMLKHVNKAPEVYKKLKIAEPKCNCLCHGRIAYNNTGSRSTYATKGCSHCVPEHICHKRCEAMDYCVMLHIKDCPACIKETEQKCQNCKQFVPNGAILVEEDLKTCSLCGQEVITNPDPAPKEDTHKYCIKYNSNCRLVGCPVHDVQDSCSCSWNSKEGEVDYDLDCSEHGEPKPESWEKGLDKIHNILDGYGTDEKWYKGSEIKQFISEVEQEAFEKGYEHGRLFEKELHKTKVVEAEQSLREELVREIAVQKTIKSRKHFTKEVAKGVNIGLQEAIEIIKKT